MSRTYHAEKGAGYEYWSRRPTRNMRLRPGRFHKRWTHRAERRAARALVHEQVEDSLR